MQAFQFFVTDDRLGAPSLMFVQTRDEQSARSLAQRMLQNQHYSAVEVWAGENRLFVVGEPSGPALPEMNNMTARPPRSADEAV